MERIIWGGLRKVCLGIVWCYSDECRPKSMVVNRTVVSSSGRVRRCLGTLRDAGRWSRVRHSSGTAAQDSAQRSVYVIGICVSPFLVQDIFLCGTW